ncbi:MAG: hypothetical protein ABW167_07745 [Baekduia sp.]
MALKVNRATWVVTIPDHEVHKGKWTYTVPAREQRIFAINRKDAIQQVCRLAHRLAGVPPYRSMLKQTAKLATTRTELVEVQR